MVDLDHSQVLVALERLIDEKKLLIAGFGDDVVYENVRQLIEIEQAIRIVSDFADNLAISALAFNRNNLSRLTHFLPDLLAPHNAGRLLRRRKLGARQQY